MSFFDNSVVISANGVNYTAWESFKIRRDFGNAISVFEFTPTEGSYGASYAALKLQPGDAITITLAGQLALTGVVTDRSVAYDKQSHQIVISGRSTTAAPRDASIPVQQGTYDGYTFEQASNAVLQPFGISLSVGQSGDGVDKPFDNLRVQYGEGPYEFISRLARMRNVFLSDDVNGNIVATRLSGSGPSVATFTEGQNILRAHAKMCNQGVANAYTVASQQPGSDSNWPTRAIAATATNSIANDQNITRLMISEHPGDVQDMQMRADHELTVSTWPEFNCTITVVGWQDDSGKLWDPTTEVQVSVYSPMIFPGNPQITLSIQSVTFSQDSANGSTTDIELRLPTQISSTAPYQLNGGSDGGGNGFANGSSSPATPDAPDAPIET